MKFGSSHLSCMAVPLPPIAALEGLRRENHSLRKTVLAAVPQPEP